MPPDQKGRNPNRIPVNFLDSEEDNSAGVPDDDMTYLSDDDRIADDRETGDDTLGEAQEVDPVVVSPSPQADGTPGEAPIGGGPEVAELVATRAELKRLEGEVKELKDALARRQADFENYRKRTERERADTYNRVVVDIAAKLLPVLDNLKRALETEASLEASESDEFRHFLSGVDLIHKQLNGVLDALGVKPIVAEGEHFNPHLHEAVVTEPSEDFEPDTVMQEIVRGYRLGDKLIRPALVKVAVKK